MVSSEFIGTGRFQRYEFFMLFIHFFSQTNLILSAWLNSNKATVVFFFFIHSISKVHFTLRWWMWSSRGFIASLQNHEYYFSDFVTNEKVFSPEIQLHKFSRSDLNGGSLIMNRACVTKSNFKQSQSYLFQLATKIFVNLNWNKPYHVQKLQKKYIFSREKRVNLLKKNTLVNHTR